MSEVVFKGVQKKFGTFSAVKDLDLTIRDGEFVSILGPSGCGKTTTLRMLAGLEYPTGGTISIGGRVVNELAPSKRDIAMVFQSYALYPHMTVAGNIEYPLRKRKIPASQRKPMVEKAASLLQLTELLDRRPKQLSGGQQQRVALGRALVREPKVFLLDEPLSNLDAKLRAHMRAELIELHQRIGRTMVYVTHDQLEAMTMSDRIAVMQNGTLQQFATPTEIYKTPANSFVAGFIGTPSMNFLDGDIRPTKNKMELTSGEWKLALPAGHLQKNALEDKSPLKVRVGIRPEDLLLSDKGQPATVKVVELTGHESVVLFNIGGHTVVARVDAERRLAPGEKVKLAVRKENVHVFDAETQLRLNADASTRRASA